LVDLFGAVEDLVLAHGPAGMEDEVRELIASRIRDLVDELFVDSMGNLIATKHGAGPKIMLDAHMDEVGIVVKHVDEDGFVWFDRHGGANERLLQGQRVTLLTRKGHVEGVIGVKGRHLATDEELARPTPVKEMWIDVGAGSEEEAAELGVRVGDLGTFEKRFSRLGARDLFCATSIDDRAGCLVLVEALKALRNVDAAVHAAFTVQEEVGCRGAKTAAHRIDPDVAIVVDTTYGLDPATNSRETRLRIGSGPSIRALERSREFSTGHVVSRQVFDAIVDAAEQEVIPHQLEVNTMAVTDAATLHLERSGIPTGEILIPRRYSHSPIEVASIRDIEDAVRLLTSVVKRIDGEFVGKLERRLK